MQSNHDNDEQTRSYTALVEGSEIGRYSIIRKIGSGGMGEVYLAQDPDLGRRVALKFLPDRLLNDEQAKARFRREAQATARLNHPNIVTIHEVGEHRANPFIAMEYIEGETLDDKIKKGPLSPEETTAIVIQAARALQAAHDQGVIHRDIKPGNVCICRDGRVKILDFGLARMADSESLTKSNTVLGTVGYNSPEQISGGQVDGRTDIWALGVLICKMLTQKLPFSGEDAQMIMYSITHSPAMDISGVRNDIPFPIQILYRRCLEKKPDKRPQSMTEVLDILGVDSATYAVTGRSGGNRSTKKLLLAILILVFIGVFIWALRSYLPDEATGPATEAWRVGILPFHNQTSMDELSAWPSIIQVLFVGNLTGIEDIGIIDPLSLNAIVSEKFNTISPPRNPDLYNVLRHAGITYAVDGMIVKAGSGFKLQANIIEPLSGEVVYSCAHEIKGEENLPVAVDSLSNNILGFFQTRILQEDYDQDIRPWLSSRTHNLEALKAFMQANEFIFGGVAGSERFLKRALELDSTFVAARIYLISGLVARDSLEARRHYQILLRDEHNVNPFERAMISWAGALIENDARTQANSLQMALEYSPGNNVLLYELARSLYTLGEYEQAAKTLRPAIDNKWRYSPAHYLLGICYCEMNDYSRARQVLERSLSISPVFSYTYGMLASVAMRLGDRLASQRYESAYLSELQGKVNTIGDIYASLGDNYGIMGLDEEAIRCYRSAVADQPDNLSFHCELGLLLFETGRWQEASSEYNTVLDIDSQYSEAFQMLGAIHDSLADTATALRYYNEYLTQDSAGDMAENIRARILTLQMQ